MFWFSDGRCSVNIGVVMVLIILMLLVVRFSFWVVLMVVMRMISEVGYIG